MASCAHSVAAPAARSCARAVNARWGSSYPAALALLYDSDKSERKELARKGHNLESLVLGDQYEIQPDGSSLNIGANVPVDTFGGEKWLRSCGAVTNLFSGDASIARSVSLTAQAYTLQVFGAGSVSCSYGTATVGSPLTFTAIVGSVTFTPTGATLWMLTATAYPVPYTPPGTTMPASHATTTGGPWFGLPQYDDVAQTRTNQVWAALAGGSMTLATRVMMGAGSGDYANGVINQLISALVAGDSVHAISKGSGGESRIVRSYDGVIGATIPDVPWPRNSIIRRFTQVNTAGTRFRVGYMIEGTHTTIQWGSWVAFDGSFNPSTLYKLMLGYNNAYPMWFNKIAVWNKQMDDAAILEALS